MTLHRRAASHLYDACTVLCLVAVGGVAFGQTPGGLLPTRERPSISGGTSREELLQRFDLNSDGRIDDGEAEMARTRMRRERNESLRNSGIDPVTGRPRGAAPSAPRDEPSKDDGLLLLPGTPDDQPPVRKPAAKKEEQPAVKQPPATPLGKMPAMTGGVRAGAPAVRPGYGATGPKVDLNAGRPREPRPPVNGGTARSNAPPNARPLPATRAPVQRPQFSPPIAPRPSVEDFGQ